MTTPHLLLVDDAPEVAALVRALTRRGGQSLTVAADVERAWKALQTERFDLVLLDVNLVGASGLELLRRLGAGTADRPPVALFCQPELTEDIAAGWALGADFLVSKALLAEPEHWQDRLRAVLARGHGRGATRRVEYTVEQSLHPLPAEWAAVLVRAGAHSVFRPLGPALLDEVFRRALNQSSAGTHTPFAGPESVGRLEERLRVAFPTTAAVTMLCAALADQLWCLFGPEVCSDAERFFACEVLPRSRGPSQATTRDSSPSPPSPAGSLAPRTLHGREIHGDMVPAILLVEDNPADVKITERALKEIGVPVQLIVSRDGQEAIDYLLGKVPAAARGDWRLPDLILLDLNLPRMTGCELLQRLRANPEFGSLPVVVLTTSRRAEDVAQMYAAGANTYIEKPQEFARFVEVLRTICDYWLATALLPPLPSK